MTDPCYIGGEKALQNNSAILEQLLSKKKFSEIRETVNSLTEELLESTPQITKENVSEVFADLIVRDQATGGDGAAFKTALQKIKLDKLNADASFTALRTVLMQQKIYTQGMRLSSNKMIGLAEQIANAKPKGLSQKTVKDLELEMLSAQAQLKNYMAHRSAIGSGLSYAFASRQVKNVKDSFSEYVESYLKNYKDAFEGEEFLQGTERNVQTKERLERELKDLSSDADLSSHVKAAEDTFKETTENLNAYKKTRKADEEAASEGVQQTLYHGGKKGLTIEDISTEPRKTRQGGRGQYGGLYTYKDRELAEKWTSESKYKIKLKQGTTIHDYGKPIERLDGAELKRLRDEGIQVIEGTSLLGKKETVIVDKSAIDSLEDVTGSSATKRQGRGSSEKPESVRNADKTEADLTAKVKEAEEDVAQLKKLNKLKGQLKRLKSEGAIKKTQAEIDKIKKQREEAATKKIEAADITSEKLYNQFLNQTLGSKNAQDFAKRITLAAKMGKEDDVLRQIQAASKKSGFHKMLDMGLQWFTGSLLSGPPTFVLNAFTPTLSRTLQQLEMATGAVLSGNLPLARASLSLHNLFYGTSDAFKLGGAALKMDKDALLGGPRMFDEGDQIGAFSPSNFQQDGSMLKVLNSDPMQPVMNTINFLTRLPNRINGSVDTINKTLSSMKYLRTHFTAEALGKKMPYNEIQEYVNKNVRKMFNRDGSLYSEARMTQSAVKQALDEGVNRADSVKFEQRVAEIMEEQIANLGDDLASVDALSRRTEAFARESTFTDEAGDFTKLIKQGLNQMPVFKFIMPFVSTPMNILHFGWRRTAVGAGFEAIAPILTKTKAARKAEWAKLNDMDKAAVRGRYATAVAGTGAMVYFASNNRDRITGGGPRNREERKALMATGWQPYSFVFEQKDGTKTYISYERVDPLATMIGLVADVAEFSNMNPDLEDDATEMIAALSFTVAENLTDKSFLRGLNNVLNITQEPEIYLPKTLKDITAAMAVPMFIDKIKNTEGEQMIRESRKLGDAILRKLPVLEERVPPKRTFLGEAMYKQNPLGYLGIMNPIYIKSTKNDLVDEKIQSLLYGFSMPQTNWLKSKDTDMREFYNEDGRQAYDRMLELTSEHKIHGKTLRQALKAVFKSPAYKQAEQNHAIALENGGSVSEDPRVALTKKIISRYRRVAKRLVIQEFPELQQAVTGIQQRNYQARTGRSLNPIPSL